MENGGWWVALAAPTAGVLIALLTVVARKPETRLSETSILLTGWKEMVDTLNERVSHFEKAVAECETHRENDRKIIEEQEQRIRRLELELHTMFDAE